jgi:outer membrane biosynthesis protein TonB
VAEATPPAPGAPPPAEPKPTPAEEAAVPAPRDPTPAQGQPVAPSEQPTEEKPAPPEQPSPAQPAPPATTPAPPGEAGSAPAPQARPAAPPATADATAPPPVEVITAPPPTLPPENGVSAIRDVTLEPGVPDLTRGRRPVAPPLARMAGASGTVEVAFSVGTAGTTTVQSASGPDLLRPAAEQAVASWVFRRTRADRAYLTAVFTYTGDKSSAVVRPQGPPPAGPAAPPAGAAAPTGTAEPPAATPPGAAPQKQGL